MIPNSPFTFAPINGAVISAEYASNVMSEAALVLTLAILAHAALAGVSTSAALTVSGIYIGATPTNVQMVQLIRTPDGRLSGRFEAVGLDRDGALTDDTVVMEGAADGAQVTLASKSLLLNSASASGFIDGNLLDLAWQGGHQVLRRGDAYAFEAAVSGLRARSAQLMAERDARATKAARWAKVETLLGIAQTVHDGTAHIEERVPSTLAFLDDASARYSTMSARVRRGRRTEEISAGFGQPTLFAMQQGARAQAISGDMEALRSDVVALQSQADGAVSSLAAQISNGDAACRNSEVSGDPSGAQACDSLASDSARADASAGRLRAAFDANARSYADAVQSEARPHLLRRLLGARQTPEPAAPPTF